MDIQYFPIYCRSNRNQGFLVWFCNDTEGILTANNHLIVFRTQDEMQQFSVQQGIVFTKEAVTTYDFQAIEQWIKQPRRADIHPRRFLDVWNMCTDIAVSTKNAFEGDTARTNELYQKLFAACNLPSITPMGKEYAPNWSNEEILRLCKVLQEGVRLFDNVVFYHNE